MDEPIQLDIKVEEEQILCQYYPPNIINSSNIQLEKSFEANKQGTKDGEKDFESISALSTNYCDTNNDAFDDDDEEEHECTLCARLFQSEKLFKAHIKEHTNFDGLLSDSDKEEDFQTIEDPDTKKADHENIPSEKKQSAQVHKNAEESPYKCLHCPKKYATKDRLQTHVNRHKKERRYECENCSKSFPYPSLLEKHKHIHTGERPFTCETCTKSFPTRFSLKVEMEIVKNTQEVWLIGQSIRKFEESKIPSNKECLQRFHSFRTNSKNTIRDSARNTIKEVLKIYAALGIKAKSERRATEDLIKLHNAAVTLKKNRYSQSNTKKVDGFKNKLNEVFDICFTNPKVKENCSDSTLTESQVKEPRKRNAVNEILSINAIGYDDPDDEDWLPTMRRKNGRSSLERKTLISNETLTSAVGYDDPDDEDWVPTMRRKNGRSSLERKTLISNETLTSFDRCGVSHRKAHLLYNSIHQDDQVSSSTLWRRRKENRQQLAKEIEQMFKPGDVCIVHWDGEKLVDCTGENNREKVERLAVLISSQGNSKLLGVPKLTNCTGEAQAIAVYNLLKQCSLEKKVIGMCYDTTSTNTGVWNGACILLEKKMNTKLLHFVCRHHILELLAKAAFDHLFGSSTSPDIPLFQNFRSAWTKIDIDNFNSAKDDPSYFQALGDQNDFTQFCEKQIKEKLPRGDDYKELLELCLIFVGKVPPGGVSFKKPEPIHRARWMSRVIYSLKIYIFRNQFHLKHGENEALQHFCKFIVKFYAKAWLMAPLAIKAPMNDLMLLKSVASEAGDPMWKAITDKLLKHLWYLSGDLVGLSFFDEEISIERKRRMVNSLHKKADIAKVPKVSFDNISNLDIEHFVDERTKYFFAKLSIGTSFFAQDPKYWTQNMDFINGLQKVQNVAVVNDCAERAIALATDFNGIITNDEEQKQYLFQVVEHSRKIVPMAS